MEIFACAMHMFLALKFESDDTTGRTDAPRGNACSTTPAFVIPAVVPEMLLRKDKHHTEIAERRFCATMACLW